MKEFTTAVERSTDDDTKIEFKIDGEDVVAFLPQGGQLAMLLASVGRGQTEEQRIAGYINFFVNVLDKKAANLVERRLLDREDPFGIDQVEEILDWLVLEWSAHPTQSPSGSASSPQDAGQNSTPPTLLST